MHTTTGYRLSPTRHSLKQIMEKGFDPDVIKETFANPKEVYPSKSHPGQYRVTGNGICLVGVFTSGKTFQLITVYADRVLTPPRPDQLDTPEGKRYAERYAKGLGRG